MGEARRRGTRAERKASALPRAFRRAVEWLFHDGGERAGAKKKARIPKRVRGKERGREKRALGLNRRGVPWGTRKKEASYPTMTTIKIRATTRSRP